MIGCLRVGLRSLEFGGKLEFLFLSALYNCQLPTQDVPVVFLLVVKRPDCEGAHALLSSAEVNNSLSGVKTPLHITKDGVGYQKTCSILKLL
jgi:hypothetical protein